MPAITLEEAKNSGLSAGNISSIASFHHNKAKTLNVEIEKLSHSPRQTGAQRRRLREARTELAESEELFETFSAMAETLRNEAA